MPEIVGRVTFRASTRPLPCLDGYANDDLNGVHGHATDTLPGSESFWVAIDASSGGEVALEPRGQDAPREMAVKANAVDEPEPQLIDAASPARQACRCKIA